ncbi:hypothetical protein BAE44_0017649, partial [Dichanthelium oligosanthes]
LVLWTIWKKRKQRVFNRGENSLAGVLGVLQDEALTWCLAGAKSLSILVDATRRE